MSDNNDVVVGVNLACVTVEDVSPSSFRSFVRDRVEQYAALEHDDAIVLVIMVPMPLYARLPRHKLESISSEMTDEYEVLANLQFVPILPSQTKDEVAELARQSFTAFIKAQFGDDASIVQTKVIAPDEPMPGKLRKPAVEAKVSLLQLPEGVDAQNLDDALADMLTDLDGSYADTTNLVFVAFIVHESVIEACGSVQHFTTTLETWTKNRSYIKGFILMPVQEHMTLSNADDYQHRAIAQIRELPTFKAYRDALAAGKNSSTTLH